MNRLSGSVGQGGRNDHDDILMVQRMLNKNRHLAGLSSPVPEDGNLGPGTAEAIFAFQRSVVHLSTPDGRVDPHGKTWSLLTGAQAQAVQVPFMQLPGEGIGYYIYTSMSKVYGSPATIQCVKSLAANVTAAMSLRVAVGDISFQNGGKMSPHASHRRGVDVDVRPLREDGGEQPVTITDPAYSRARTKQLVEIAREDPNLKSILFNDKAIAGVSYYDGHHNHLHLRFKE